MKIRHSTVIAFSGITWMGIGGLLLFKGFSLVLNLDRIEENPLFFSFLKSLTGTRIQASLLLICLALFVGFLKGRMVLGKSANRIISRIVSMPNPCPLSSVYPRYYLILLASMMSLGMLLKWIPIPYDLKGFIDVAVGAALINGSAFYFRYLTVQNKGKV